MRQKNCLTGLPALGIPMKHTGLQDKRAKLRYFAAQLCAFLLRMTWSLLGIFCPRIALYSFRSIKLSVWRWICTATTPRHTRLPISSATWKPISSGICIYCPSRKQEYEHCDFQKTVHVMIIPPFFAGKLRFVGYGVQFCYNAVSYDVQRTTRPTLTD